MNSKYIKNEKVSIILFFFLFIMYLIVYMTKNCYGAAMVFLVNEKILTKSQTGTITALFYVVYAIFQVIGGFAADRFSPFKLIGIGLLGAAVCNFLITLTDNYYYMLIIWSFNGMVQFGIWPSVFKITSSCLSPLHRKKGILYMSFSGSMGLVASYMVAGFVTTWKTNFTVSSLTLIITLVLWVTGSFFFKRFLVDDEDSEHGLVDVSAISKINDKKEISNFDIIIKSGLIILLASIPLHHVIAIGAQSYLPNLLNENYKSVSPSIASFLTVIPIAVGILGSFLADSVYKRKKRNECSFSAIWFAVTIPLLVLTLLVGKINEWFIVVIFTISVLFAKSSGYVITALVPAKFAKIGKSGTIAGLINAMASSGIVLSNIVSPQIADNLGWKITIIFWIICSVSFVVLALLAYVPWKRFFKDMQN